MRKGRAGGADFVLATEAYILSSKAHINGRAGQVCKPSAGKGDHSVFAN